MASQVLCDESRACKEVLDGRVEAVKRRPKDAIGGGDLREKSRDARLQGNRTD
jgi:hypothetical protein